MDKNENSIILKRLKNKIKHRLDYFYGMSIEPLNKYRIIESLKNLFMYDENIELLSSDGWSVEMKAQMIKAKGKENQKC